MDNVALSKHKHLQMFVSTFGRVYRELPRNKSGHPAKQQILANFILIKVAN